MEMRDDAIDALLANVIRRCRDVSMGTLWWVCESFWEQHLSEYCSDRDEHPGVSLWQQPSRDCCGAVPLLYGSSKRGDHNSKVVFFATDLSPKYPEDHKTYFQTFGPTHGAVSAEAREFLPNYFGGPRIRRNRHKEYLSPQEVPYLKRWMRQRGFAV
ncbi:MAG: hypothetical protein ACXWDN_02665 [Limisphaerales bacterium]